MGSTLWEKIHSTIILQWHDFFFFEMLLHINIHNPKGQSLLIHPSNWTETELGAFKSFQVNALDKVTNGDRCPRDIKEVSLVGGCQWTVVTDDRLWTGDFSEESYGPEVMKRWLDSDYMLSCFTEALFILLASVTSRSRTLSTEIHGELLQCTLLSEQWVSMSAACFISFTALPQHDVMSFSNTTWVERSQTLLLYFNTLHSKYCKLKNSSTLSKSIKWGFWLVFSWDVRQIKSRFWNI